MIENAQLRQLKRKLSWLLAILASGAGLGWYLNRPGSDAPLYQSATVSRGDLAQIVTASGPLDPVTKVEVGSQISGSIQKLFADFNSAVKEGQVITVELTPGGKAAKIRLLTGEGTEMVPDVKLEKNNGTTSSLVYTLAAS